MWCGTRTAARWCVMAAAGLALSAAAARASTFRPMSIQEMAGRSDLIVSGTVIEKASRWEPEGRFIVTDFAIAAEELMLDRERRGGDPGEGIRFTLWGGTVGEVTDAIADMPGLEVGDEAVLFLRAEEELDALTGGPMGILRVGKDPKDGRRVVRGAEGRGVSLVRLGGRTFVRDRPESSLDLEDLLREVRAIAEEAGARLREEALSGGTGALIDASGARFALPAADPELPGDSADFLEGQEGLAPLAPDGADPERYAVEPDDAEIGSRASAPISNAYSSTYYASLPILMNQFPSSFGVWYPEDQYQMSKWNAFNPSLFRVYATPTGTYGWGNGRFDMAGWPSSTSLLSVYGTTWSGLGNAVGVTFWRVSGGRIVEADVAFNPGPSWTLDDVAVMTGASTAVPFRGICLHELGHVWGANHSFNRLSIMNYGPLWFSARPELYADDVAGVRALYPASSSSVIDLGVSLYFNSGYQSMLESSLPSQVFAGSSLTLGNVTVENLGTSGRQAAIELYLTSAHSWSGTVHYLGSVLSPSLASGGSAVGSYSVPVPSGIPGGSYYVGAFIRASGWSDPSGGNNSSFSRRRIAVIGVLTCSASAQPARGPIPLHVAFTGGASGGVSPYTFSWSFGDGTSAVAAASAGHDYLKVGAYTATFTVKDTRGTSCSRSVTVTAVPPPPKILGVAAKSGPYRLVVVGESFVKGAVVRIDGAVAPVTVFKSRTKLVAGKGAALAAMAPPGSKVSITVRNPDGSVSAPVSFTVPSML